MSCIRLTVSRFCFIFLFFFFFFCSGLSHSWFYFIFAANIEFIYECATWISIIPITGNIYSVFCCVVAATAESYIFSKAAAARRTLSLIIYLYEWLLISIYYCEKKKYNFFLYENVRRRQFCIVRLRRLVLRVGAPFSRFVSDVYNYAKTSIINVAQKVHLFRINIKYYYLYWRI